MGNIITLDQALQILLDALNAQNAASPDGTSSAENSACALSFNEWCKRLGLPRPKLDRYIRQELGCSGSEFVHTIRSQRRQP